MPIVKFVYRNSGISCDISFKVGAGIIVIMPVIVSMVGFTIRRVGIIVIMPVIVTMVACTFKVVGSMVIMPVIVTMVACTIRWVGIMVIMPVIVITVVCTIRWVAIMMIMPVIMTMVVCCLFNKVDCHHGDYATDCDNQCCGSETIHSRSGSSFEFSEFRIHADPDPTYIN